MSAWIKVEKDLANDPRVLRMASRLRNADITIGSRSKLVVIGALVTLWWYADTHIGNDDVLPIGIDQIDELVGLAGFCDLMPSEWLQIIDANSVKLVDYFRHNGSIAKARALNQRRQEVYRNSTKKSSRKRNAVVTPDALPDKTRQDIDKTTTPLPPKGGGVVGVEKTQSESDDGGGSDPVAQENLIPSDKPANVQFAIALRNDCVLCAPSHPTVLGWANDGFTLAQVQGAIIAARRSKPRPESLRPQYIDVVLRRAARAGPKSALERVTWQPPPDDQMASVG